MTAPETTMLRRVGDANQPTWFGKIAVEGAEWKAYLQFPHCAPCLVLSRERKSETTVFVNSADHGCSAELWLEGRPFIAAIGRDSGGYRLTIRRHDLLWVEGLDDGEDARLLRAI